MRQTTPDPQNSRMVPGPKGFHRESLAGWCLNLYGLPGLGAGTLMFSYESLFVSIPGFDLLLSFSIAWNALCLNLRIAGRYIEDQSSWMKACASSSSLAIFQRPASVLFGLLVLSAWTVRKRQSTSSLRDSRRATDAPESRV